MMLWLLGWLGGWLDVRGDARSAVGFLNLCMKKCYPYWRYRRDETGFSFRMRRRVWRELARDAEDAGLCLAVTREGGFPRILRQYRGRWGLGVGLAAACGLIWLSSQFVWRVEVSGTNRYAVSDVLDELEDQGVGVGSYMLGVEVNRLQNDLLIASDRFAWITVNLKGTTAQVEVVELVERTSSKRETAPANLVASVDGQITRLELRDGWASVAVGDVVSRGQLLAAGIAETKDARTLVTRAEGKVFAQVMHQLRVEIPFRYMARQPNGQIVRETSIIFFEKTINLSKNTGIVGGSCDIIENERILSFFGSVRVPVSRRTLTHIGYDEVPAVRDEGTALALAEFELRRRLDALSVDRELIRQTRTATVTDEGVALDCTVWCIEDIACTQPIALGAPTEVSTP